MRRVEPLAVTGCGTINALGTDVASFWSALAEGRCGIGPLPAALGPGPGTVAASVAEIPSLPGDRLEDRRRSRTERLALAAACEALRQAGLFGGDAASAGGGRGAPRRVAVVLGTTTGGIRETEEFFAGVPPRARGRLLLLEMAGAADAVAARFALAGPRLTLHTACASSASAILTGADLVRDGRADAALVGGADSLARLTLSGFRSLRLLDPRPCRPFDRSRRGLSLGEGAGMLVLERPESAAARGAPIRALLLGGAETADAHHLTAPAPEGARAAAAIGAALASAGLAPGAVDHVNAHGTGTPANDAAEAAALAAAFGSDVLGCPVASIKGSVGHTLGAAGAIEAIAAIETMRHGAIPPTAGLEAPDPAFGLDLVRRAARRRDCAVVLSNSFGFGGANAVLCFGRAAA